MIGVIVFLVVLLVAIPVGVLMSGGLGAGIIGWVLKNEADATHEGSELIDLNG